MDVVLRFNITESTEEWFKEAQRVLGIFQRQPGFDSAKICLALDSDTSGLIFLHFDTVGNYRRALSSYEIKLEATQFLLRAIDEPSAYEVLFTMNQTETILFQSEKTADALEISLGDSASARAQSRIE